MSALGPGNQRVEHLRTAEDLDRWRSTPPRIGHAHGNYE
jgi:hypothetical protein